MKKKQAKKSIAFLLTGNSSKPAGGYKVVYEYANRLAADGYDVTILYPVLLPIHKLSLKDYLKFIPKYIVRKIKGYSGRSWFPLDPRIKEKLIPSLNWKMVPNHEIFIATAVRTSYPLSRYPIPDDKKYYLIQGFEDWGVPLTYLLDSYKLGLRNLVVSNWLKEKVESTGTYAALIKNGFNFNEFKLNNNIETRSSLSILMMYAESPVKGCKFGIEALYLLKQKYPKLKARLFGTCPCPDNLQDWIEYYQNPDKKTHNKLYNEAAIYIAPSLKEGWGLPVGEAMMCGAAIVCTDTLGFQEMVQNEKNGLIVPVEDSNAIVKAVSTLIENPKLRIRLAKQGNEDIQSFTWENSYTKLKQLIEESITV